MVEYQFNMICNVGEEEFQKFVNTNTIEIL